MSTASIADATPILRYCIFCGSGKPGVEDLVEVHSHKSGTFSVSCGQCGCEGPSADSKLRAIERWNDPFVLRLEAPPQAGRRPLDPVVDARVADILSDLAQASAAVDVAAGILADSDAELAGNAEASQVGLSLRAVHKQVLAALDRLDTVNLLNPSRRLVVRTDDDREVFAAA